MIKMLQSLIVFLTKIYHKSQRYIAAVGTQITRFTIDRIT